MSKNSMELTLLLVHVSHLDSLGLDPCENTPPKTPNMVPNT